MNGNKQLILCFTIAIILLIVIMKQIPKQQIKETHQIKIDGTYVKKDSLKIKINK